MNPEDSDDSDLNDIHKIEIALAGASSRENDSEYYIRCDSGEGYSPSEASTYQQHLTPSHADNTFSIFEELTSESVEEDRLVISELEPSYENALCLNRAYQSMLFELSQQLDVLRNVNEHKQKILLMEIEILKAKSLKKPGKKKKKAITFSYFGMPYFKDVSYKTPPLNSDAKLAYSLGFRNISLILMYKPLSKFEIRRYRRGLKEQAIVLESTRLVAVRDKLQKQLQQSSVSKEQEKAIQNQMEPIQRQIYNVRSLPEDQLYNVPPASFDWIKLSIQIFRRSRTPDQLRLHWMHHLRPGVNSRSWTHEENRTLKELVKKYGDGIDWDEVAKDTNGRTAFDCFRRYQEKFNIENRKFGWSNEDNVLLLSLIGSFNAENMSDIYWEEVRRNFPGKSKSQIYAHFRYHLYSLDPSPFSAHEDVAILEGIKMGYDFSDISLVLGKRSISQIRYRYRTIRKKVTVLEKNWTEEENNMLLAMPDPSSLRAHIIRRDFPGRNFPQLFSRFHYLRMKSTTPKKYIEDLKNRRIYSQKSWFPKENRKLAGRIISMMSTQGYNHHVVKSMSKTLPMLKNNLLNFSRERNLLLKNKSNHQNNRVRDLRRKRSVRRKEKELKAILHPLLPTNLKRPRKLCLPGDGRELGLTFTSIYRLLQCNFVFAPEIAEFTEENCEEYGVAYENYLPFKELLNLTEDLVVPDLATRTEQLLWLPPSLGTLTGFRGLDLHRAYLRACASAPFEAENETATITDITDDPTPGPSGYQSEIVSRTIDVQEETIASGTDTQQEHSLEAPLTSTRVSKTRQSVRNSANRRVITNLPGASIQVENDPSLQMEMDEEEVEEDVEEIDDEGEEVDEEEEEVDEEEEEVDEEEEEVDEEEEEVDEEVDEEEEEIDDDGEEGLQQPEVPSDVYFGDRVADSLLLSRLTTLFFWSGIMGSMYVPDVSNKTSKQGTATDDPLQSVPAKTIKARYVRAKKVKAPGLSKKEIVKNRKQNLRQVVFNRFGKCKTLHHTEASTSGDAQPPNSGDALPSVNVDSSTMVDAGSNPPPAKKVKKTPIPRCKKFVPKSDRVTRRCKKLIEDNGN